MMFDRKKITAALPTLALAAVTLGSIVVSAVTYADEAPPPASAPDAPGGRHHNPAWAACKKQADDQKMQPGDARRDFMKTCMKSAHDSAAPPPAS